MLFCNFWLGLIFFNGITSVKGHSMLNPSLKKNYRFILSERSDFHMVDNLSTAVHAFPMYMLTSPSVDEILQPRYMKRSTNFSCLSFNVEMAPSCFKNA